MTDAAPQPDNKHTEPPNTPVSPPVGGTSAGVTNQTLLALDPSTFQHLHHHQVRALNVVQLEFARDVASRTAQAYQQTIDVLRTPATPTAAAR